MQVHSHVGVFPTVNTTILPGLRLAEFEDVEPWIQRTIRFEGLTITYTQIIYSAESQLSAPNCCHVQGSTVQVIVFPLPLTFLNYVSHNGSKNYPNADVILKECKVNI